MSDTLATWIGERLLVGSLQGAAVVAVVWLTCRLIPRMPAATQAMLWWLATLKLALVFAPVPSVPVAVLPSNFEGRSDLAVPRSVAAAAEAITPRLVLMPDREAGSMSVQPAPNAVSVWIRAVALIWFGMLVIAAGRLVYAHRVLRGIVRRSIACRAQEVHDLATRLGVARVPSVHVSDEISSPQVFGLWRPVVLVPADLMATFTPEEWSMTLGHELMHVRRRDLALGWIPAIAERLFFFHPLARLSAREYLAARESACDVAVVRALGVPAADYGRMLMRLGIAPAGTTLAASGSPFSTSSLKRRLHMLQHHSSDTGSRRWRWAIVVAAAAVLPLQLAARAPAAGSPQPAPTTLRANPAPVVSPNAAWEWQRSDDAVVYQRVEPGRRDRSKEVRLLTDNAPQQSNEEAEAAERIAIDAAEMLKDVRETQDSLQVLREAEKAFQDADTQRLRTSIEELMAAMERQRLDRNVIDEQSEAIRKAIEQQMADRQFAAKLARMQADALRAAAETSQAKGKTAEFLGEQLRQMMVQQQEALMRQYEELRQLHERVAADQRKMMEELKELRESLKQR